MTNKQAYAELLERLVADDRNVGPRSAEAMDEAAEAISSLLKALKDTETALVWALDKAETSLERKRAVYRALQHVRRGRAALNSDAPLSSPDQGGQ